MESDMCAGHMCVMFFKEDRGDQLCGPTYIDQTPCWYFNDQQEGTAADMHACVQCCLLKQLCLGTCMFILSEQLSGLFKIYD